MTAWGEVERGLLRALRLSRRPVAVAFRDAAPAGVAKFSGVQPSGCSFWRLAAAGRAFYTVASDHHNCPIGGYTHNVPLPDDRAKDLEQTLGLMVGLGYVRMEEVPGIPRLPKTPGAVVYAPLGDRVMLLLEAAGRAGVATQPGLLGRPTCMALPAALGGGAVASTGCTGNRVYTDLGDDELYVAIAGRDLPRVAAEMATITSANDALADYHRERRRALATE
jgi:uncharacterized protein (DUF169 family)